MRRFIAGAVCPQCRAMDRIVLEEPAPEDSATSEDGHRDGREEDNGQRPLRRRRCVSCGYSDTIPAGSPVEPARRFSRPREGGQATPVRIVEPPRRRS